MNDKRRRPSKKDSPSPAGAILGVRLRRERQRRFVGRQNELSRFTRVLADEGCSLLFLSGLTGVGKTSLLREYERICLERAHPVALIDGAELAEQSLGSPRMRRRILADHARREEPPGFGARPVLLVDRFERLGRAQEWFLNQFVPGLSRDVLLVFASRQPAPPHMLIDDAWTGLMEQQELQPFSDVEAHAMLNLLGVSARAREGIVDVAGGYPLALTLAAEVMRRSSEETFTIGRLREWQGLLIQVLGPESVSVLQRLVLDVCALARTTTLELVEHVIRAQKETPGEPAHELVEWLARQSFMERVAGGLRPHPLVRLALFARARQERPRRYGATYRSVREYCVEQMASGVSAESGLTDLFFLDRDSPVIGRLESPDIQGEEAPLEPARDTDHAAILQLIEELEGSRSREIAEARLRLEPHAFEVVRSDPIEGLFHARRLMAGSTRAPVLAADDPVTPLVEAFMNERPLEDDEEAMFFRWFADRRHYQTPCKRVLAIAARQTQIALSTKRLAYTLSVYRHPQEWVPLFQAASVPWQIAGRFSLDGQDYSLLAFLFRERPLKALLNNAWNVDSSDELPGPANNGAEEKRLKLRQRVADIGRKTQLTPREQQILELLSLGSNSTDISTRLRIRPRTVKFHYENVLRKTGASSRSDLFRLLL